MMKLTEKQKQQRAESRHHYRQLDKWQAALQRGWLADYPGKTVADYKRAGTCRDSAKGEREYSRWVEKWMAHEGAAIHARIFK